MKKTNSISLILAAVSVSALLYGGGDIVPTVFEEEDVIVADEEAFEDLVPIPIPREVFEEVVTTTPTPTPKPALTITPTPTIIPTLKPTPIPTLKPMPGINGFYAGLGIATMNYKSICVTNCGNKKVARSNSVGFSGVIGYNFNDYIGIETRGFVVDNKNWTTVAFLKPKISFTRDFSLYALLGGGRVQVKNKITEEVHDAVYATGGGMNLGITPNIAVFADYQRLFILNDNRLENITIGTVYNF